MSLERFTRRERRVRLGGRSIGIGRFRFHLGGGWYTVGPLSVLKVYQLHQAQARAGAVLGKLSDLSTSLASAPLGLLRAFTPLFVLEDVNPRHLARMSLLQVLAVAVALTKVNDLAYIEKALTPKDGARGRSSSFDEWVVTASRILGRPVEEILHLPFEQVVWNLEVIHRLDEQQKPASERSSHELDADEVAELNHKLAAFGVEVADA